MAALRFYLDENLQVAIAEQLKQRGIEASSVRRLTFVQFVFSNVPLVFAILLF